MTATPRVQHILDVAAKCGWEVEDRGAGTWAVHPANTDALHPDGFTVYNSGTKGARVVSQNGWKAVTQKDALTSIQSTFEQEVRERVVENATANQSDDVPRVEVQFLGDMDELTPEERATIQTLTERIKQAVGTKLANGEEPDLSEIFDGTGDLSSLVGKLKDAVHTRLAEQPDIADFSHGAILAAAVLAELVDACADQGRKALEMSVAENPGANIEDVQIGSRGAASAYLSLVAATHDPVVRGRVFRGLTQEPNDAMRRGAQAAFASTKRIWETLADGVYMLDVEGEQSIPVLTFLSDLHEHAQHIRDTADDCYGRYVAASDSDFEELLK